MRFWLFAVTATVFVCNVASAQTVTYTKIDVRDADIDKLKAALEIKKQDVEKLKVRAREEGMFTLRESAIKKLLEGVTTYQEVLRVTWEQL